MCLMYCVSDVILLGTVLGAAVTTPTECWGSPSMCTLKLTSLCTYVSFAVRDVSYCTTH